MVSLLGTRQLHLHYHSYEPGSYTYGITVRNQAVTLTLSLTRQLHIWYHCQKPGRYTCTITHQAVTLTLSLLGTRQLHIWYHCQKPGSYTYTITHQAVTHMVSLSAKSDKFLLNYGKRAGTTLHAGTARRPTYSVKLRLWTMLRPTAINSTPSIGLLNHGRGSTVSKYRQRCLRSRCADRRESARFVVWSFRRLERLWSASPCSNVTT